MLPDFGSLCLTVKTSGDSIPGAVFKKKPLSNRAEVR